MKHTQSLGDVAAISLSTLCFLHCLAVPVAIIMLPVLSGSFLASEQFHFWMIVAVLPVSLFALTLGCKDHGRYAVLTLGLMGLAVILSALFVGEEAMGGYGEKVLTAIGSTLIVLGHIWNFRLCRQPTPSCECAGNQIEITKT